MNTKIVLVLLAMVSLATFASADIASTTISSPADGEIIYPNMSDPFLDVVFTTLDDENAPIMRATVKLDDGDVNRTIFSDTNLSSSNCTVSTETGGTQYVCTLRYTFPTTQGETVGSGNYDIDLNVAAFDSDGDFNALRTTTQSFAIDNRYISAAVQTVSLLLPIVLLLAAIIGILLGMYTGVVSGETAAKMVVGLIVLVVVTILIAIGLGILTP
jgi:hypothetical protein